MEQTQSQIEEKGKLVRYLVNASARTIENFQLKKLAEGANLKRDLSELIEKLADAKAEARLANLIGNYLRNGI